MPNIFLNPYLYFIFYFILFRSYLFILYSVEEFFFSQMHFKVGLTLCKTYFLIPSLTIPYVLKCECTFKIFDDLRLWKFLFTISFWYCYFFLICSEKLTCNIKSLNKIGDLNVVHDTQTSAIRGKNVWLIISFFFEICTRNIITKTSS